MPQSHLLAVWNPSYEADAMDAHVSLLLRHARASRSSAGEDGDDVYVWWGKLRSPHRQQRLPHLDRILALEQTLADEDAPELHLYLTDYRSLYVAHVASVTADDVREDHGERGHIPPYYFTVDKPADCWFQLWDIRRLVVDDTPAVIEELRHLRNTAYHDMPVSIYGGMVDLPLIVTRADGARWFDEPTRDQLTGGRHWVELDAERSAGAGEMQRELRENRFGPKLWTNLDPAARQFFASAEHLYRSHRGDASFDLSTALVDFAKGVEVQVNVLLRAALAGAPAAVRCANVDGKSVDLARDGRPLGLGELAHAIGDDEARNKHLRGQLGGWFAASLPPLLVQLKDARNPAAHGDDVARAKIASLRDQMIGVGCKGWLLDLAEVRVR